MNHSEIDTGMLRAYLDGEAVSGREHISACDACQTELKDLRIRAAGVGSALDELPAGAAPNAYAAWTRLRARMDESENRRVFWTPMRAWGMGAAGLLAAAVLLVATVAPVRAWAESLLAIFRVEHVTVLDLDANAMNGLANDQAFNQAMTRVISEEVTVTRAPQKPQQVTDEAAASKLAGFQARLLAGETPSSLVVRSGVTAQMKLDRDRLQSIVDEAGRSDLRIPGSVDGAVLGIGIPAGIMATYGHCAFDQAGGTGQEAPRPEKMLEDSTCVMLSELPSPTVSAPQDLNPAEIAQVALQFAGLSASEAANFTQTVDWTTTFVLPVLRGRASYKKVSVAGNDAVLLRPSGPGASAHFDLVWVDNGIVYSLMGTGDDTTALNLAATIE